MIYLNNYCTDVMFLVIKVCVTLSSTILSLKIFNFPFFFKISLLLLRNRKHMTKYFGQASFEDFIE